MLAFFTTCQYNIKNVILLYICVSVVLSQSLCRKERQKLDIILDSMVMLARVLEI
jgi:hypothetical protein